jgi:hypothetical protein
LISHSGIQDALTRAHGTRKSFLPGKKPNTRKRTREPDRISAYVDAREQHAGPVWVTLTAINQGFASFLHFFIVAYSCPIAGSRVAGSTGYGKFRAMLVRQRI